MSDATQAHQLLAGAQQAAEQTVRRSRASWFPLVVFGLLVLGALPVFVQSFTQEKDDVTHTRLDGILGGWFLPHAGRWVALYWLIALPAGYLATALYFRWRARRSGVASRPVALVATGGALLVLLLVQNAGFLGIVPLHPNLVVRGLSPLLTVAFGILVLAVADRSKALAGIALAFLGLALLANLYDLVNLLSRLGWSVPYEYSLWPNLVVPGVFLLVSGLALRPVQRLP